MSGNALPYYPRYPRDFFEGTAGLSLEEKGAYGLVLDLIYMMGDRGLPDDPQYIAGQLGTSVRKWNSLRKSLIERGKLTAENGIISNKRADKVKIKQRSYQDNQAENARGSRKNNDLKKPSPTYREEPNTEPKLELGKPNSCSFDEFWGPWPNKNAKEAARKAWAKLKAPDRDAAKRAVCDGWYQKWQAANPRLSPIHPASFLNGKRWTDEFQTPLKAINGDRHERPASKSATKQNAFIGGAVATS